MSESSQAPCLSQSIVPHRVRLLVLLAPAVLALAVYWPTFSYPFVDYDDPDYVVTNQAIQQPGLAGIWYILSHPIPASHGDYLPVSVLSHWLDYQLWQLRPGGYHLTNALLHAANAALICLLLTRLTGRPAVAVLAACLFGLHPMNTEAVTWVSERKSVLSMFWMLLSFNALLVCQDRAASRRWYAAAVALYLLACLSKTSVVFYPLIVLAQRVYLHRRPLIHSLVWTMPFVVLAALTAVGRMLGHHYSQQLTFETFENFSVHVLTVVGLFGFYLFKLALPFNLNCAYPHRVLYNLADPAFIIGISGLVLIGVALVICYRRAPLVGFFLVWYLGGWLPHSQIIPIPPTLRADRYVYFSGIGLFALLALVIFWLAGRLAARRPLLRWGLFGVPALGLCLAAAVGTVNRNPVWSDSYALWSDSVAKNPDNSLAQNGLGAVLDRRGELDAAVERFRLAVRLDPLSATVHFNLGTTLFRQGRLSQAIIHYKEALRANPRFAKAHSNLGYALFRQGRTGQAIDHYSQALKLAPDLPEAHYNMGVALAGRGQTDLALTHYSQAVRIRPDYAHARYNLARLLMDRDQTDQAIVHLEEAVRAMPDYADAHHALGLALADQGQLDRAVDHFSQAVRVLPSHAEAHYHLANALLRQGKTRPAVLQYSATLGANPHHAGAMRALAWFLATSAEDRFRNGARALRLAQRACQLTGQDDPEYLDALAAAYAETGQFSPAVATARRAVQRARLQGRTNLASQVEARLKLYQLRQPFRQPISRTQNP